MKPKLTLVGAGPGDGELITLKGIRALRQADVVLYDDLANHTLLDFAPEAASTIYVGKRAGKASFTQQEINELIVRCAQEYGHVVRLKGGDPYVFGRGFEEQEYARQYGIQCEVVSGVSSCIAVPASQGIPVTSRGVSESFWVITGTTRKGELSDDLRLAVQSKATVIVLMGMGKLDELCAMYCQAGRGHLPMAIVQNGTRADEQCVIGQVWNMPMLAAEQGVGAPAVLVIGEVVSLHPSYLAACMQNVSMAQTRPL
ncbi:uroporphyrinogen-III C-methyltransferase [Spirosoma utsteinense]|uniref:uroporphyrinogen-III C-methyltransferase n=1 Tax=Spirosoma utsteinense TaxID=2585773 RepID=A0ABR6VZ48_9BACT|nr:uroporphyrinogen-III C-methyltransferase [Spirosoma utsteinense]MBC3784713.1 uroporphyrin-III C-methyltransferase [Spirosoma utsteinense]MBC3789533.1 uroporphyrin-III C-methyltransferase [Spirosoma utsteinense]